MDRRKFLLAIGASLIPKIIRVTDPCINLYGIPYHHNGTIGTWMGIERSTIPMFKNVPVISTRELRIPLIIIIPENLTDAKRPSDGIGISKESTLS